MHPLVPIVAVGAVLRLIAVAAGCGWFAPDDLGLAIEQPFAWLAAPTAPMADPIRSPILPNAMYWLFRLGRALGLSRPEHLLRLAYAALGAWSLAAIPATYLLARRLGRPAQSWAAALCAGYCLMPLISVRGLIEVLAIVPLMWGLVAVDSAEAGAGAGAARRRGLLAGGGMLLGAATLLRFQLGMLLPCVAALLLVPCGAARAQPPLARALDAGALVAGASLAGLAQVAMDLWLGRGFLGTLRGYLTFNLHHSQDFGTSAWHTYLVILLGLTLPPATLVLARPLARALRRHALVAATLVPFVAVHSCIGHKEDRFLFTVLPLFFVLLGDALATAAAAGGWARRGQQAFVGLNAALLIAATLSDAHRNITVPLLQIGRERPQANVAAVGFRPYALPAFYLGGGARVTLHADTAALAARLAAGDPPPDYLLLRSAPDAAARAAVAALPGLRCEAPRPCPGDWMDRVLVAVNRHNALRAPTALARCEATARVRPAG